MLRPATERGPRPLRPLAGLLVAVLAACSGRRPEPSPPPLEPLRALAEFEGALARGADPGSFETLLLGFLNDSRPLVRRAAARSIARAGHPLAVPWLLERYSREEDPLTRVGIVWALGQVADRGALALLRETSRAEDPRLRAVSAEALASSAGASESAAELARLLDDPVDDVRLAAALALVRHPELPVPETFTALLGPGEDERLRWAAMRAISVRPELAAASRELLREGVLDANPLVSIFALEALPGISGSDAAVAPAATLAADPERWWLVRVAARRALERWLSGGGLSTELESLARDALSRKLPRPETRAFPRMLPALEDSGGAAGALEGLRRRPVVLEVEGKGEIAIELFSRRAPHHTGAVLALARQGAYRDVVPLRADPLGGIDVAPLPAGGGASEGAEGEMTDDSPEERPSMELAPLPPEPHREPIRRGTLIALPDATNPGRFLIAAVPMPELEGRATVLGRVVLGARLLDSVEPGDRLTLHVPD